VTAGPGERMTAAGDRGQLRASHADREQVIDVLKAAFVQGRLTKDELDARVGKALTSRTYADLAALSADIPAGLVKAQPPREPSRGPARPAVNLAVIWGAGGIIPLAALVAGLPAVLPWQLRAPVLALVIIIYETLWVAGLLWFDPRYQMPSGTDTTAADRGRTAPDLRSSRRAGCAGGSPASAGSTGARPAPGGRSR
jgi:uncharacterized protein DUF1707